MTGTRTEHFDEARLWRDITGLRRSLHREPETGLDLPLTQRKVLDALDGLPLTRTTGRRLSSVTAVLRGAGRGPAVLLRADMDALPGPEESGVDFASKDPERVHSCGHDLHVAALVGAAHLLSRRREQLKGDVVFMFQPGEEGQAGAKHMCEEGVLDAAGDRVVAAYALHVLSSVLPHGWVATRGGPLLAAADVVRVTVTGRGGHGSQPHLSRNPVVAGCAMVTALQALVPGQSEAFDPVIVNVGVFHAGTQHNIVPGQASFEVSIRSFSAAARLKAVEAVRRTVDGLAAAHGVAAEAVHEEVYPVLTSDVAETEYALRVAGEVVGDERTVRLPHPQAASEDFSYVLEKVPGAFLFLGACPQGADPGAAAVNHSANAVFDDSVLPTAALLLSRLAERRLAEGS